jgi:glycosyltransferase involved in cell wall biosynthesis
VAKLSVTIITKNEAAHVKAALDSVAWADERIVVDACSTDATVDIARQLADRVVVREWPGYGAQKNFAASLAAHDWILSIDADERVTPALAASIRRAIDAPAHQAYRMSRVTRYFDRWIRSTDWYPDHQLRLYDRREGSWNAAPVHEGVIVDGTIGDLTGELEHFPYRDLADHLDTINRYTTLAARQLHESGRRASLFDLTVHPPLAFLRNYVAKAGIRDGSAGLVVSGMNAYYVFLKFAKLRELGA